MFEIGTILNKENYTQAAIACNKAGDRHIEKQGEQYIIVANRPRLNRRRKNKWQNWKPKRA